MGTIDWIPIADLPDALKDGRDVLLFWPDYRYGDYREIGSQVIAVGRWKLNHRIGVSYFADTDESDDDGLAKYGPSHFAEIDAPQASMPGFEG